MANQDIFVLCLTAVLAGVVISFRRSIRELMDEINNRRGGPPPMHPLPANDGHLVGRRFKKEPNPL
jgi:hypothetical protein